MAKFSDREIFLTDIVTDDETFRLTSLIDKDADRLTRSLDQVGLLSPPLLKSRPDSSYQVIAGFRRVEAARRLGWSSLSCRLVPGDTPPLECLKMAVADNTGQRSLNLAEQAAAVVALERLLADPERLPATAALLGLPCGREVIEKLKAIVSLPAEVQEALAVEQLGLAVAVELAGLEPLEALRMTRLFRELRLGMNRQKEVLRYARETAAREKISLEQLLQEPEVQQILADSEADRGQRATRLRDYLKRRRYPALWQAEKDFEEKVRTLKPGPAAAIYPPENFEGQKFSLRLSFKNGSDLKNHLKLLQRMIDSDLIQKYPPATAPVCKCINEALVLMSFYAFGLRGRVRVIFSQ